MAKVLHETDVPVSLPEIHRGTNVGRALEATNVVRWNGKSYAFTTYTLKHSYDCGDPAGNCRRFFFGHTTSQA